MVGGGYCARGMANLAAQPCGALELVGVQDRSDVLWRLATCCTRSQRDERAAELIGEVAHEGVPHNACRSPSPEMNSQTTVAGQRLDCQIPNREAGIKMAKTTPT